jgi:GTP diphosphokinase / guanosine-3',5'-bis(diphosphate) 3'-diphosphatase
MENRGTFFNRLVFLPEAELMKIQLAYTLAKYFHRAQKRKELDENGKEIRYFEHLRRVALILIDELAVIDTDMICAALLHDSIEDTKDSDLTPQMIEHHFGPEVYTLVRILSKKPKEGYLDRLSNYGDWKAIMIKGCDRLDNLRSLPACKAEFQKKQIEETKNKYYPLFSRLEGLTPSMYKCNSAKLFIAIKDTTDNFEIK